MTPAPLHTLPGDPPLAARAFWVRADDDVRLRLAHWPAEGSPAGTILLFPGRTEYLEKYMRVGRDLASAGYEVLGIDWRGQGMSDRLQTDPRPGHVADFADFQRDVVEAAVAADQLGLPRPWHLLAHSMGGAIGLAALLNDLSVAGAVFSAPMWGILPRGPMRRLTAGLVTLAGRLGRAGEPVMGSAGRGAFVLDCAFNDNRLTADGQSWGRMVAEAAAWPELTLGGASYGWVAAAMAETTRLAAVPASEMPQMPVLVTVGGLESVISSAAISERVKTWPHARLMQIPGGRHEAMFETPERRTLFLKAALSLFDEAGRR